MDLLYLGKVLWRKSWIIISVPLIAGIAAFFLTRDIPDKYLANAQIATGYTVDDQVQLTEQRFSSRDTEIRFSNLLSSMHSGLAMNMTSFRLLLHDLDPENVPFHQPDPSQYRFSDEEVEKVRTILTDKLERFSPLLSTDPDFELITDFLIAYGYNYNDIVDNLSIDRIPNTDYINIAMKADKPALAALGANAYTEEFIRYHKSLRSERTSESVEFLRDLSEKKRRELEQKQQQLKDFKSRNNVYNIEGESGMKMGQLSSLETEAAITQSNITRLQLQIRNLRDNIAQLSAPSTSASNQRILELRSRINEMNARYITEGASNQALLDSLNFLREELRMEQDNSLRQGAATSPGYTVIDLQRQLEEKEIELRVQQDNMRMIRSKMGAISSSFSGFASKEAELAALNKDVELATQEWTLALDKYNEARNRQLASENLRMVLRASPPVNPEPGIRLIIIALAIFLSATICLSVIVGMEVLDGTIRTPDRFKRMANLPIVGAINRIDSRNFNIRTYFNQQNGNEDTEMFKSLLRKFRHEVESMNAKVILFTSPKRREGKTFTTFSLAYVLSLLDKRILILDTNFKNNSLSQILGRGQSDLRLLDTRKHKLLVSAEDADRKPQPEFDHDNSYDLINPTKYKNIFIVGNSGGGQESPAEILSGRDFGNLVTILADSFDYVLMEGASLNEYSDTKELVRYADKVVAVFSADATIKHLDREAIHYLKSLGKKFGGAVLNRVELKDLKL